MAVVRGDPALPKYFAETLIRRFDRAKEGLDQKGRSKPARSTRQLKSLNDQLRRAGLLGSDGDGKHDSDVEDNETLAGPSSDNITEPPHKKIRLSQDKQLVQVGKEGESSSSMLEERRRRSLPRIKYTR